MLLWRRGVAALIGIRRVLWLRVARLLRWISTTVVRIVGTHSKVQEDVRGAKCKMKAIT